MRNTLAILLILSSMWPSLTAQEVIIARRRAAAGAPPTSSPSASNVGSASATSTGITIPGTTFSGTSGSLVLLTSQAGTTAASATVVFTLSGATCSASSLTTAGTYVTGVFQRAIGWCLLSNSATVTPSVTWTGTGVTFTALTETMFTSTSGFNASPLDQSINTAFSATAGTSCASGNTSATTNANDLVVGVAFNFNTSQTYPTPGSTGYTAITASSRDSIAVQYKNVSATGVQSFTIAISSDVWACSVYAFKMN